MSKDNYPLVLPEQKIPSDDEIKADKNVLWRDDALDRKKIADALTNLVRNEKGPLVISIDGDWGIGKTFFLKRWQKQLAVIEGFEAVYYNAWEDDFHSDPLISILGQLAPLHLKGWDRALDALVRFIRKVDIGVTMGVVEAGININDALDSIKTEFEKEYDSQGGSKTALKEALAELSEEIAEKRDGRPLIIIIDELDRCRPTFAIELLERVKHVFNVPNIVFILSINKASLCKSVKSIYGDIEANAYLRRFVNMEFIVPKIEPETFCQYMAARYMAISDTFPQHQADLFESLAFWARYMDFSLRDIEDCFRSSIFVMRNVGDAEIVPAVLIGMLVALRLKHQELYKQYISKECNGAKVMNYILELINEYNEKDKRNRRVREDEKYSLINTLDVLEGSLYAYDQDQAAQQALNGHKNEWGRFKDSLSNRVGELEEASINLIIAGIDHFGYGIRSDIRVKDLSNLIELVNISE